MRFLVTGGAGFIGSNIVERLLKDGHFVRVLDNFSSGKRENLNFVKNTSNFELIKGDIQDKAICEKACKGMDRVLHQAALTSVRESLKSPDIYNSVNIGGSLNILAASVKAKVKRVVLASSTAVYGNVKKLPVKELELLKPISPYALSKLAVEHYSLVFSENSGLETVNLRYFNVFGPRQSPDSAYAAVIPKFIRCMLNGKQPKIYGTGKQSRDFIFIDNVVEANLLAATRPGLKSEVFNVGDGKEYTILRLVNSLNKIIGKDIKPVFLPAKPGDIFRSCADISKIKRKLGYRVKVDFEAGLRKTVDYLRLEGLN
jgi:UDP-N-acetylglucosamine 4-epimerase